MSRPRYDKNSLLDYLILLSNDVVLDAHDRNVGSDLLRRIAGNFIAPHKQESYNYKSANIEKVENLMGREIWLKKGASDCPEIQYVEVNPTRIQTINREVDIPNLKIPIRVYADRDDKSVKGDYYWKQFLYGGEFAGEQLPKRLNSEKIYYDASFAIPFLVDYKTQQGYKFLNMPIPLNTGVYNVFSNYYDYNHNVQKYQDWSQDLESELLMPNFYVVSDYYSESREKRFGIAGTIEDITLHSQLTYMKNNSEIEKYHFPDPDYWWSLEKDEYFGTFFTSTSANSQYRQAALNGLQNILFDQHYFEHIKNVMIPESESPFIPLALDTKLSSFFNIEIKFDRHSNGMIRRDLEIDDIAGTYGYKYSSNSFEGAFVQKQRFRELIKNSNFSSRMLEILKDIDDGTITDIQKKRLPFNYVLPKRHFSYNNGRMHGSAPIADIPDTPVGLQSMNFMDFLAYTYNNYDVALNDNYIFAGPSTTAGAATMNDDTFHRTLNAHSLGTVIDGAKDLMKAYMSEVSPGTAAASTDSEIEWDTHKILEGLYGPNFKHKEVLAYKLEKIDGAPTGDSSTQNVIQKFWIFNSQDAPEEMSIYDSQVKYGKEYTYKLTAYTLVMAHKYKYGDFRLTKQIGASDYIETSDGIEYCLQFYNPENNMIAPQLFADADRALPADSHLRTKISSLNRLAPNSVEISQYPQLLDFHLYFEPCLELVEVPLFQRTVKVMDNPCNSINVVPFHFIDNSNRVGFQVNQESFIKRPYPEIINSTDLKNKIDYLKTKEIQPYNMVELISQSPARYIEMYRTKNKPNSFADFNDSLVATVDLRIKNEHYNFKNKMVSDEISPNTTYYYVFRFVNENGVPGPLSQIIQCELVNDGGYTYALFDTVDSSEFNPDQVTTNSITVKKIMQFDPNIKHLTFNDQNVDYEDYAHNQINNLVVGPARSRLWDKKFKVRLTSKKTSKKIDLNITHSLIQRNLSKMQFSPTPPTVSEPIRIPTLSSFDDPEVVLSYETGAEEIERIAAGIAYGARSVSPPPVDIDSGEISAYTPIGESDPTGDDGEIITGGEIEEGEVIYEETGETSFEPVRDGLVTEADLMPAYFPTGLLTQGVGFPVTFYQLIANAPYAFIDGTAGMMFDVAGHLGGLDFIESLISADNYEPTEGDFNPSMRNGEAMLRLVEWMHAHHTSETLFLPIGRKLAIVGCLYMLQLIPHAHRNIYGFDLPVPARAWKPGGSAGGPSEGTWNRYAAQVIGIFERRVEEGLDALIALGSTRYDLDSTWGDFEGSSYRPEEFNMSTLLVNLGIDPGFFDAIDAGVDAYTYLSEL